jgi:hypothetical protein
MAIGGLVGGLSGFAGYGCALAGTAMQISGVGLGLLYGAASGALIGAAAGGTTAALYGTDFWKGVKMGAITGAITGVIFGGIDGGITANRNGRGIWWNNKIAYNRSKWSMAWWDRPDRAFSPIEYLKGTREGSCFPATMAGISKSYGNSEHNEDFWIAQYEKVTGLRFDKETVVSGNEQLCQIVNSVSGYDMNPITAEQVLSTMSGGDRVLVSARHYLSPEKSHAMSVRLISEVPDVSFNMTLSNPATGYGFRIFNKNEIWEYGLTFYRIQYTP